MNIVDSSVLDFPRKTLPKELWDYDEPHRLPQLNSELQRIIMERANILLNRFGLRPKGVLMHGGAASYQWSPGTDIDINLFADWPYEVDEDRYTDILRYIYDNETEFKGYPINMYLRKPGDNIAGPSEAIYDVKNDEWVLPPLILPQDFDPHEYFKPFIDAAKRKSKKFDDELGELRRAWTTLYKASEAQDKARDPEAVDERRDIQKEKVADLTEHLSDEFDKLWTKRKTLHEELRDKLRSGEEVGRFERFQEAEIVWKYLERHNYIDFLKKLNKLVSEGWLEGFLARY